MQVRVLSRVPNMITTDKEEYLKSLNVPRRSAVLDMSGKGDKRRPSTVSAEVERLRWELAFNTKDKPNYKKEVLRKLKELNWNKGV